MGSITSINLTYTTSVVSVGAMDGENRTTDADRQPSQQFRGPHEISAKPPISWGFHECECPEPCNCDHDNE